MAVTFKLRRGMAADWAFENPILAAGEPGLELDTDRLKVGDGINSWSTLPYYLTQEGAQALIDASIQDAVLNGVEGTAGKSAYQVAVDNGFVGTETQWLASLVGPTGPQGLQGLKGDQGDQGPQGLPGTDGADGADYTGPTITVASTAPSSPSVGDVWIDTSS